ncbi:GpE family phage tail protein [Thiocapsa sp. UBA6158]
MAAAWHWPPSEMSRMGMAELMDWEARAARLLKAQAGR